MSVEGLDVSFEQVLSAATSLGLTLTGRFGVSRGTKVAVVTEDCPAWLAAVAGIWWAGGITVVLDRTLNPATLLSALDATGCDIVITELPVSRQLADVGDRRAHITRCSGCDWTTSGYFEGVALIAAANAPSTPPITSDPEEDALIAFTSGSSGTPKGVISSHQAVLSGMLNSLLSGALIRARNRTRSGRPPIAQGPPCSLLLTPFSHVGGYSHLILMTHLAGKVVPLKWNAARVISAISRERATVLSGADPPDLMDFLSSTSRMEELRSLSAITTYGSALSPRLMHEIQSHLPFVSLGTGYGLTETNGSICAASGRELEERPGSCGPVLPSVEVSVRDESGDEVEIGCRGAIWLRGSMLMRSYAGEGRAGKSGLDSAGWFCTNDFGWLDTDGYIYVSERREDIVEISGIRISCARIERMLCDDGLVKEASLVVVRSPTGDASLIAAIVPLRGSGGSEGIAARLEHTTSLSRSLITVLEFERLPRTASGKPDRKSFRQIAHRPAMAGTETYP
jgi:long-chain acyl-CoA synthetase